MGGQCTGAPELKGPPRERERERESETKKKWRKEKTKKKKKTKRKGRKEKRESTNISKYPDGGHTRYIPMSLSRWDEQWGIWAPMYFFFHLAWHLQFLNKNLGPISLEECNGAILNGLKRIRGQGPPISPSGYRGGSNFPIARASNLPHYVIKGPPMFLCAIKGPIFRFPHQVINPQFPHCFKFPHWIIKGPRMFHCAIKGPQFPHNVIKRMTCNFSSRYQRVPIYHCAIKGLPIVTY